MTPQPLILLPGILMPARLRYEPLLRELGDEVTAIAKDLEVYATDTPPSDYTIDDEVEGVVRTADDAGFDRFHVYGHSGGGAVALAFAAAHPDRVLTLAVDEPAFDFSAAERASGSWAALDHFAELPPEQRMPLFLRSQLKPGVEPPPRPDGPPPPWMANRPAGIEAFMSAARKHEIDDAAYARVTAPVYYSYGDLSSEEWVHRRDRLATLLPNFQPELYEGLHHLNTSHQAEPARVADALRRLWQQ
jgi:pimeloyl-ACP methyl ester carboxylesterase